MSDEYADVEDEEEAGYQEAHKEIAEKMRAIYPTYPVIEYGDEEEDAPEPEHCDICGGFLILIDTVELTDLVTDNDRFVQDVYKCEQCGAEQRVDVPF